MLRKKEERPDEEEFKDAFGSITVIENVFGFKQVLPLQEGDNVIGRRCVGTNINTPIETSDMSMDRRHCIINVKRNKQGKLVYTLQDAPSLTGTFLNNEILGDKDRIRIEDGAIVTIGATTFILRGSRIKKKILITLFSKKEPTSYTETIKSLIYKLIYDVGKYVERCRKPAFLHHNFTEITTLSLRISSLS